MLRCEKCGCSFHDIVKSGKLGCADCYGVFDVLIHENIKKLQGRVRYQVLMRLRSKKLLPRIYDIAVNCSTSAALAYVEENPANLS